MSCYVCNRDTFEKVIKAWTMQGEALRGIPTESELEGAWLEIVGANYDAFNERYPNEHLEPEEDELVPPKLADVWYNHYSKKDIYDALNEYMYQVCDLDGYEHREAYYKCRWCLDTMLRRYIEKEFEAMA